MASKPFVFDLDDLCDDYDPWSELHALKGRFPGLKVTLFAIPARCSNGLLARYSELDWAELAVHGYYHSPRECAIWAYDETQEKMREVAQWWPGVKLFKAPGWIANEQCYDALDDDGWLLATHAEHEGSWRCCSAKMYTYNGGREDVVPIHGHTWDVCDNGPSDWDSMFADVPADAEFKFVSEVCRSRSYVEQTDLGLKPGDLFVDVGAFIGEEIQSCVERGVRIESYEPHPKWFGRLQKKWGDHPLVKLNNAAVWKEDDTMFLWEPQEGNYKSGSSLVPWKNGLDLTSSHEVQCLDAESVVGDKDIAVLKIDAEGAEWEIIGRILDTCGLDRVGRLFVEDHAEKMQDNEEWHAKRKEVLARLEALGRVAEEWP